MTSGSLQSEASDVQTQNLTRRFLCVGLPHSSLLIRYYINDIADLSIAVYVVVVLFNAYKKTGEEPVSVTAERYMGVIGTHTQKRPTNTG